MLIFDFLLTESGLNQSGKYIEQMDYNKILKVRLPCMHEGVELIVQNNGYFEQKQIKLLRVLFSKQTPVSYQTIFASGRKL